MVFQEASHIQSTPGHENFPVNYVSWGSAARFVNWLQNGKPTGSEGPGTTETGAYALNGAITSRAGRRHAATQGRRGSFPPKMNGIRRRTTKEAAKRRILALPDTEQQWPSNVLSATGTNNANFFNGGFTDPTNYLTPVGAFADSPGPYGTFDQGGDLFQWNETAPADPFMDRDTRGGSFLSPIYTYLDSATHFEEPITVLTR